MNIPYHSLVVMIWFENIGQIMRSWNKIKRKYREVYCHIAAALIVSATLHFIIFPYLLSSTTHSPYFSESGMNDIKKLNYLNVRSAECTKLAKDFWQNQSQEIVRAGNNQKRHHSLLMLESTCPWMFEHPTSKW